MNINRRIRKQLQIGYVALFIAACSSSPIPAELPGKVLNADSLNIERTGKKALDDSIHRDEKWVELERFWSSPLVTGNNFSFRTGYLPIDQLKDSFDLDPGMKATSRKDIERGDCAYYIRSMTRNTNKTLHYVKGDCGEYGFSNDQYYLENDSLKLQRRFSVGINTWPDEKTVSTWKVTEEVYCFEGNKVQIKKREIITPDFTKTVSAIRKVPFVEKTVAIEPVYEQKKKELVSTLEMKTIE